MTESFFPERKFDALLFDFDGTVADTMPRHFEAWNAALAVYGQKLTVAQHYGWAGQPTREIVRLLNQLHGVEMSLDVISKAKESAYFGLLGKAQEIKPVTDIVRYYVGKLPMAVVSGSRRRAVEATMNELGLSKYFAATVCAEDYEHGKPAPDCFLKAAALLGVPPDSCLAFEDAELGIQSAQSAGMACVRVIENRAHGFGLSAVT